MGPETEEKIKLAKDKIRFDLYSFENMIRTLAFRSREKFDNSFYFKIIGTFILNFEEILIEFIANEFLIQAANKALFIRMKKVMSI